jgi:hypothetical protein
MLFIILSWLYIAFIFVSLGILTIGIIDKINRRNTNAATLSIPTASTVIIAGMITTTIITLILSFIIPLGLGANLIFFSIAAVHAIVSKHVFIRFMREWRTRMRSMHWTVLFFFIAYTLIIAYLCAGESSHHDDGLYYTTTIRWGEEYPVINGLVNINPRIGFNSAWHSLQALFSFSFLHAGYFNDLNGFILLTVMGYGLNGMNDLLRRKTNTISVMQALVLVPLAAFHFTSRSDMLLFNINFLSAPTADLPVCLLIWMIVIWTIGLDKTTLYSAVYNRQTVLIGLLAAFLVVMKPSAAPVLLIPAFLFFRFLLTKRYAISIFMVITALLVLGPWILRNVFISGYLVFPFTGVDIVQADWKLPIHHVAWLENAVKVYAIDPGYDLNVAFTVPVKDWIMPWFERLSFIQSVLFVAALLSIVILSLILLANVLKKGRRFFNTHPHVIIAMLTMAGGFFFWLLKGPDFRLGYGYVVMLTLYMLGLFFNYFLEEGVRYLAFVVCAVLIYASIVHYQRVWEGMPDTVFQKVRERRLPEKYKTVSLQHGVQLRLVDKDDSWGSLLPAANAKEYNVIKPVMRGPTIRHGFRASKK